MIYTLISPVLDITHESQLQINSRQLATKKRKTLVLDLDETLIHSTIKANETGFDFQVDVNIEGAMYTFYIFKRPHVNYFLEKVCVIYLSQLARSPQPDAIVSRIEGE